MITKKNRGVIYLSPEKVKTETNLLGTVVAHLNKRRRIAAFIKKPAPYLWFFGKSLRNCEKGMKFLIWKRYEISDTSLAILDIKISIEGNGLCTSVYYKPIDSHSYFLYSSSHPSHVKNSILFKWAATVPIKLYDSQHYKRVRRKNGSHSIHP